MRRFPIFAAVTAVTAAVTITGASASPPTGMFSYKDHARGESADGGQARFTAGTDASSALYTVAAGAGSGWRTQPGTSVLAVTKGTMTVLDAHGCTTKEYPAGKAAVLPAGQYQVGNAASVPLEFAGFFLSLPSHGPKPLVEGAAEAGPPDCSRFAAAAAGDQGVSLADLGRGTFVAEDGYSHHHAPGTVDVMAGKDVGVSTYRFEPGFATGWHTHYGPSIAIVLRGTWAYYEGHDGKCVPAGRYTPGQAYTAIPYAGHRHLAAVEGDEPVELIAMFLNMPRTYAGVPVFGQQLDGNDFGPAPPADCPRLR